MDAYSLFVFFAKRYGVSIVLYTKHWGNNDQIYTYYYIPYPDGKVVRGCA